MGRRLYSRQSNGRFRRATLENTFGLSAEPCPKCRILNVHKVGEPAPENCHSCGAVLHPVSECSYCGVRITLRLDQWTDDDGMTACVSPATPCVPHKPKEG